MSTYRTAVTQPLAWQHLAGKPVVFVDLTGDALGTAVIRDAVTIQGFNSYTTTVPTDPPQHVLSAPGANVLMTLWAGASPDAPTPAPDEPQILLSFDPRRDAALLGAIADARGFDLVETSLVLNRVVPGGIPVTVGPRFKAVTRRARLIGRAAGRTYLEPLDDRTAGLCVELARRVPDDLGPLSSHWVYPTGWHLSSGATWEMLHGPGLPGELTGHDLVTILFDADEADPELFESDEPRFCSLGTTEDRTTGNRFLHVLVGAGDPAQFNPKQDARFALRVPLDTHWGLLCALMRGGVLMLQPVGHGRPAAVSGTGDLYEESDSFVTRYDPQEAADIVDEMLHSTYPD